MLFLDDLEGTPSFVYPLNMPAYIRLYDDTTGTYYNTELTLNFSEGVLGVEYRGLFYILRRYNYIDRALRSCLAVEDYTDDVFNLSSYTVVNSFDGVETFYPENNISTVWHLIGHIIASSNILNRMMNNRIYIDVYDKDVFMFKCIVVKILDMKKFSELAGKIKMLRG